MPINHEQFERKLAALGISTEAPDFLNNRNLIFPDKFPTKNARARVTRKLCTLFEGSSFKEPEKLVINQRFSELSKAWQPKNFEEACKRNAGRRKLHMQKRKDRADRILRLLAAMDTVPELRESAYGWLSLTAETMKKSKATASRDFALARRIHGQFAQLFGRPLNTKQDRINWSWDWSRGSPKTGHTWSPQNRPYEK